MAQVKFVDGTYAEFPALGGGTVKLKVSVKDGEDIAWLKNESDETVLIEIKE